MSPAPYRPPSRGTPQVRQRLGPDTSDALPGRCRAAVTAACLRAASPVSAGMFPSAGSTTSDVWLSNSRSSISSAPCVAFGFLKGSRIFPCGKEYIVSGLKIRVWPSKDSSGPSGKFSDFLIRQVRSIFERFRPSNGVALRFRSRCPAGPVAHHQSEEPPWCCGLRRLRQHSCWQVLCGCWRDENDCEGDRRARPTTAQREVDESLVPSRR